MTVPRFSPPGAPPPPPPPASSAPRPSALESEPVALAGAVQGVLIALLAVLQGFGVTHISQEQTALLLALYAALVAALTAAARAKAWSPASVARLLDNQRGR